MKQQIWRIVITTFFIGIVSSQSENALEFAGIKPLVLPKVNTSFFTNLIQNYSNSEPSIPDGELITCTCAVFLSGQFKKMSSDAKSGLPALLHEQEQNFPCTPAGVKLCTNKCLDSIVKHLPNSAPIICGSIDRDCHKERAYLFIQNCTPVWVNTNLSAGREYCCKDGVPYKCPLI